MGQQSLSATTDDFIALPNCREGIIKMTAKPKPKPPPSPKVAEKKEGRLPQAKPVQDLLKGDRIHEGEKEKVAAVVEAVGPGCDRMHIHVVTKEKQQWQQWCYDRGTMVLYS